MKDKINVVFVCSSNICRSPYSEYVFKKIVEETPKLKEKINKVSSCAVFNKSFNIHPKAVLALKREGFDEEYINSHKPRYLFAGWKDLKNADLIIGMNRFNKYCTPLIFWKKFKTLSEVADFKYKDIPDPFLMKNIEDYYSVMDIIKDYLVKFANNILNGKDFFKH